MRVVRFSFFLALSLFFARSVSAQETSPHNGVKHIDNTIYALHNANIILEDGKALENASLIVKGQHIIGVGQNIETPSNAVSIDLNGKWIYPSFVDITTHFGMPKVKKGNPFKREYFVTEKPGAYYWNEHIAPERSSFDLLQKKLDFKSWKQAGIGVVNSVLPDGIIRGCSFVMALANLPNHKRLIKKDATLEFSLQRGSSDQTYPTSTMGAHALLRQFWEDIKWYKTGNSEEQNMSLETFITHEALPKIFVSKNVNQINNILDLTLELEESFIIAGVGKEYTLLNLLKNNNSRMVIPLNFPQPFNFSDPYILNDIPYAQLKHWEVAPHNPNVLYKSGIKFAFTCQNKPENFLTGLRKAVQYGLPENEAIKAITIIPAQWLKVHNLIGSIKKNKLANFFISDKNIIDKKAKILEHWVLGKREIFVYADLPEIEGLYNVVLNADTLQMVVKGSSVDPKISFRKDTLKIKPKSLKYKDGRLNVFFNADSTKIKETSISGRFLKKQDEVHFKAGISQEFGKVSYVQVLKESSKDTESEKPKEEKSDNNQVYPFQNVPNPFQAFGFYDVLEVDESNSLLVRNVTIWTNGEDGVLEDTDILMLNGKISRVGNGINPPNPNIKIIDGTGKHLTPGIIDEHSHIAIRGGVNECSQANTAEVSIEDAIDPLDIDIYHSLAGGVVAAQLLHGSCNPIGGRSALVKLKWGESIEEMIIENAAPFIKFALGENVKKSNWGNQFTKRYPQTRMGVEQVYDDAFHRALEYEKVKKSGKTYRKDLELEVILEILKRKRFVTCHSYVQSEINMLMKIAEKYGFRINTFTHILEGYKIADIMRKHGAAASTFSDWWTYKFEVKDAIPYNAALMHQQGVLVALNSDDSEMMRRLNQEAAKTIKYGGVSEEDALKMVTLNPAKILHLDDRMGYVKEGMEANVVLWSGHPLSMYTKAEKTIIDGKVYFDLDRDKTMRDFYKKERVRIMKLMAEEIANGVTAVDPIKSKKKRYHCDD